MESQPPAAPNEGHEQVAEHVVHARHLLEQLRERLEVNHPEIEQALLKLESALNLLTIKSGGLL